MFSLDPVRFEKVADQYKFPSFRLKQIREWIFSRFVNDFYQMTNLPRELRDSLAAKYQITGSQVVAQKKTGDGTVKLLLQYPDGAKIESVIMGYRDWSSACISTQVGCAMGCTFCATGSMGLVRNLTWEEMVEQLWHCYRFVQENSLKPIRNMVLMGIGEPLANFRNVADFIKTANSPEFFDMGQRRITISTVGMVDQINNLAQLGLAINLAVSLHAPNDKLRNQLMPISRKYPLQDILAACRNYTDVTGRRVTFEYLLLDGINDQDRHAIELSKLLKGMNCLLNLIHFNEVPGTKLQPSKRAGAFYKLVEQLGLNVTVRRSLGADIDAACGQLRRGTSGR